MYFHGRHFGANQRIRLNRPSAAAMRPYVKLLWPLVIRPHRITTYVDAAYCCPVAWSVGLSVCLSVGQSTCHSRDPCKDGWTDRVPFGYGLGWAQGRKNVLDEVQIPYDKGQFWGDKGWPIVYLDAFRWAIQNRLNRSRCRLDRGLGWTHGSVCYLGCSLRHLTNTTEPSVFDDDAAFLSNYFDHLHY